MRNLPGDLFSIMFDFFGQYSPSIVHIKEQLTPPLHIVKNTASGLEHDNNQEQHAEIKLNHKGRCHIEHQTRVEKVDGQCANRGADHASLAAKDRHTANESGNGPCQQQILQTERLGSA